MSDKGVIKQIIGAVIDVEFDKDKIPNIYDALVVHENNLVLELYPTFLMNACRRSFHALRGAFGRTLRDSQARRRA